MAGLPIASLNLGYPGLLDSLIADICPLIPDYSRQNQEYRDCTIRYAQLQSARRRPGLLLVGYFPDRIGQGSSRRIARDASLGHLLGYAQAGSAGLWPAVGGDERATALPGD